MSSIDNIYKCDMHNLGAYIFCSNKRKVANLSWLRELNKCTINVYDLQNDVWKTEYEMKLLSGFDEAGKVLIGNLNVLKSCPVALKDHLEWIPINGTPRIYGK